MHSLKNMQIIDLIWLDVRFCGFTFPHWNCTGALSDLFTTFNINTGIAYSDSSPIELKLGHSEEHGQVHSFLVQKKDNIRRNVNYLPGGSSPHFLIHRKR